MKADPSVEADLITSEAVTRDRREASAAREHLANERTLLAWVRTSITLIGLGFVVAQFGLFLKELEQRRGEPGLRLSVAAGLALIIVGIASGVASVIRFFRARRQIQEARFRAEYWPEVLLTGMTGILAVALAIYLGFNG